MTIVNALPLFNTSTRPIADFQPGGSVGAVDAPAGGERSGAGIVGDNDDSITISNEARERFERSEESESNVVAASEDGIEQNEQPQTNTDETPAEEETAEEQEPRERDTEEEPGELTESEQEQVDKLEARDAEVRAHEQAHLTAAGSLAKGPPKYDYQRGPDGKQYAVGGSVEIDVGPVPNDPQATVLKADKIKRAALAPAEPSGKDRQVASQADAMKAEAQREIQQEALEGPEEGPGTGQNAAPASGVGQGDGPGAADGANQSPTSGNQTGAGNGTGGNGLGINAVGGNGLGINSGGSGSGFGINAGSGVYGISRNNAGISTSTLNLSA